MVRALAAGAGGDQGPGGRPSPGRRNGRSGAGGCAGVGGLASGEAERDQQWPQQLRREEAGRAGVAATTDVVLAVHDGWARGER